MNIALCASGGRELAGRTSMRSIRHNRPESAVRAHRGDAFARSLRVRTRSPRHHPPRSNTGRASRRICVGFAGEHSDCAPIPGSALTTGERAGRPNGALHEDQEVSHASAEPSAAHTVELWESVRHTAGFGRGVVRISEIPALAAVQLAMLAHVEDEPTARVGHSSARRPTT